MDEQLLENKYLHLQRTLRDFGSVAVAFSGGVDSAFLLRVAHDVLGQNALAITAVSHSFPKRERDEAAAFCEANGIRQIALQTDELAIDGFAENPKNRCYICKKALFSQIIAAAAHNGISTVAEGSNMDDLGDYRPGLQAIAELGVQSPLRTAELTKEEIRTLSKRLGLPTWNKPSYACLASRFVYGERITAEKLAMVEQAEQRLLDLGFVQHRVRIHGSMARIELLPQDFARFMQPKIREQVYSYLKSLGFSYVTLDLGGYRMGSMNEILR